MRQQLRLIALVFAFVLASPDALFGQGVVNPTTQEFCPPKLPLVSSRRTLLYIDGSAVDAFDAQLQREIETAIALAPRERTSLAAVSRKDGSIRTTYSSCWPGATDEELARLDQDRYAVVKVLSRSAKQRLDDAIGAFRGELRRALDVARQTAQGSEGSLLQLLNNERSAFRAAQASGELLRVIIASNLDTSQAMMADIATHGPLVAARDHVNKFQLDLTNVELVVWGALKRPSNVSIGALEEYLRALTLGAGGDLLSVGSSLGRGAAQVYKAPRMFEGRWSRDGDPKHNRAHVNLQVAANGSAMGYADFYFVKGEFKRVPISGTAKCDAAGCRFEGIVRYQVPFKASPAETIFYGQEKVEFDMKSGPDASRLRFPANRSVDPSYTLTLTEK